MGDTEFVAEILSEDDPRGLTIGYDTGCCMTLGGASESCIWAGYEDPRYSFFAVYDEAGRLRAQSVMYLAKEDGKQILVVDNIEVNAGTELQPISEIYKMALTQFAQERRIHRVGDSYWRWIYSRRNYTQFTRSQDKTIYTHI